MLNNSPVARVEAVPASLLKIIAHMGKAVRNLLNPAYKNNVKNLFKQKINHQTVY